MHSQLTDVARVQQTPFPYTAELVDFVDSSVCRPSGSIRTIVDLRCGTGRFVREFALRGWRSIGVDSSPRLVEVARSATADLKSAQVLLGSTDALEHLRNVDCVIALGDAAIELSSQSGLRRFFELARTATSTGALVLFDVALRLDRVDVELAELTIDCQGCDSRPNEPPACLTKVDGATTSKVCTETDVARVAGDCGLQPHRFALSAPQLDATGGCRFGDGYAATF